ncbi:hypothetical protein ACEWY4_004779 [Coilia grayii]|uniref:Rho-GAP domain-containing protein n=1 Tax=Coilia grayii TaxID=363190 RepID=A0ABD1KML0_9TELE
MASQPADSPTPHPSLRAPACQSVCGPGGSVGYHLDERAALLVGEAKYGEAFHVRTWFWGDQRLAVRPGRARLTQSRPILATTLLDLTEQFAPPEVSPPMLLRLMEAIERKGLDNPTLYRTFTAGGGLEIRQCFDSDPPSSDLDQFDLPMLCDGLRRYLQDLPQPVIPGAVYSELVHIAQEVAGPEECSSLLRRVLQSPAVPPQHWLALQSLLRHLARVCQASARNLLSARALGEIFSPLLFRQQATSCEPSPDSHIRIIEVLVTSEWGDSQAAPGKQAELSAHQLRIPAGLLPLPLCLSLGLRLSLVLGLSLVLRLSVARCARVTWGNGHRRTLLDRSKPADRSTLALTKPSQAKPSQVTASTSLPRTACSLARSHALSCSLTCSLARLCCAWHRFPPPTTTTSSSSSSSSSFSSPLRIYLDFPTCGDAAQCHCSHAGLADTEWTHTSGFAPLCGFKLGTLEG